MEVLSCSSLGHFEESGTLQAKSAMGVDYGSPINVNKPKFPEDGEKFPEAEHDAEHDEACHVFKHSHVIVDIIESELSSENNDEDSSLLGPKFYEKDDSIALWVKWRGKWQVGVKCEKADWPLDVVEAKPTHDRKNYIVIFFPDTKKYSWVDTLLVRPIHDLPEPIVHRSHEVGVQLVKDLTVARRFIMQKLAVGILNIVDRLHFQALVETAANINAWKEFAMEAPRCKGYPDLGRMLVKLRKMILEQYMDVNWLQHSFSSWVNQCQSAPSAESIEHLREELVKSILWKEISAVQGVQGAQELTSEWKMWKHEVIKLFSTSHPISSIGEPEQPKKTIIDEQGSGSPLLGSPQASRKRPKLEVRRAELHNSHAENKGSHENSVVEADSGILVGPNSNWQDENMADPNADSVSKGAKLKSVNAVGEMMTVSTETKGRKCQAYIESKGRHCVRWANESDDYCCVHLAARFTGNAVKGAVQPVADLPICGGTTTLGSRCKHRALPGGSFCKKHGPRDGLIDSPFVHHRKRKHKELVNSPGNTYPTGTTMKAEDEQPLEVEPISMRIVTPNVVSNFAKMPGHLKEDHDHTETPRCIGLGFHDDILHCLESPKRHLLYCEKHIPSWLKRARNGKTRIISKEVYMDLLRGCSLQDQKVHLHQACELFYKLFKSISSARNQVPREIQFQWALSEASKDPHVAKFLMKLVVSEKARIQRIWGFVSDKDNQVPSSAAQPSTMPVAHESDLEGSFEGQFGSEEHVDDQSFGEDWIASHKKEAQWYFKGYACSICFDSFTNRKVLEAHVQERHHAQFSDNCMLFRCIPCGSHFGNSEELWSHVLSSHKDDFRQTTKSVEQRTMSAVGNPKASTSENASENAGNVRKYICKFCGLKFDLLPDLGRHHQAAHMGPNLPGYRPTKKGVNYYAYRLKSGRVTRPKFKKALGGLPYRLKNKVAAGLKKRLQTSTSLAATGVNLLHSVKDSKSLGRLAEPECSSIAKWLYSKSRETRARPNNHEILRNARTSCCKVSLQAHFEGKYGIVPERLYLRAAKLCSEHNIRISWHQEGFSCPNGCRQPLKDRNVSSVLTPLSSEPATSRFVPPVDDGVEQWEKDESHIIINSNSLRHNRFQTTIILCDDISFGKESSSVICIIDKNMLDSLHVPTIGFDGQATYLPWESLSYIVRPLLHPSLNVDTQNSQLGCGCSQSMCTPDTCDHVYLFNTDYEDAKDVNGKDMIGRFPYDGNGQVVLEDKHVIYECNHLCKCDKNCPNRVLQNGVQVKLEVFKTLKRGWAVKAAESIPCGKFVCEYIGEVIDEQEANRRRERYGLQHCNYLYNVGESINKTSQLSEERVSCVIDASKYGNVSRFINHSCSPNLASRIVLVESMDYHLAHIGLYTTRDITIGEELTRDYGLELQPGEGSPCYCCSSSCRGRLF